MWYVLDDFGQFGDIVPWNGRPCCVVWNSSKLYISFLSRTGREPESEDKAAEVHPRHIEADKETLMIHPAAERATTWNAETVSPRNCKNRSFSLTNLSNKQRLSPETCGSWWKLTFHASAWYWFIMDTAAGWGVLYNYLTIHVPGFSSRIPITIGGYRSLRRHILKT